jgi:hypothetical protein
MGQSHSSASPTLPLARRQKYLIENFVISNVNSALFGGLSAPPSWFFPDSVGLRGDGTNTAVAPQLLILSFYNAKTMGILLRDLDVVNLTCPKCVISVRKPRRKFGAGY